MRKKKVLWCVLFIAFVFFIWSVETAAGLLDREEVVEVDWRDFALRAEGYGLASETRGVQAGIIAREAALTVAHRRIREEIAEIPIDGEKRIKDLEGDFSSVEQAVRASLDKAPVVEEEEISEEAYKVVVQFDFYGSDGLLSILLPYLEAEGEDFWSKESSGESLEGSGLIVDTKELELMPALLPRIYSPKGELVYGRQRVDLEIVEKKGVAVYEESLEEAKANPRSGEEPLILKPSAISGKHKADLIFGEETLEKLARLENLEDILSRAQVVIVL